MFQHLRQQGGSFFSPSQARPATTQGLAVGRGIFSALLLVSVSACVTSNDSEKPSLKTDAERERQAEAAGVVDSEHLEEDTPVSKKAGSSAISQSTAATKQKQASDKHPKLPPAPSLTKQAAVEKSAPTKPASASASAKSEPKNQAQLAPKGEAKSKAAAAPATISALPNPSQSPAPAASVTVQQNKLVPPTGRMRRTVSVQVLNVRSQPNTKAKIVGRLTRGTQLPVAIEGHWAKIGENQYVLAKFLRNGR